MKTQCGNVIFLILFGIVLFAALSYAVSGSMRGGDAGSKEKVEIGISEAFALANDIENGVKILLANGCTPEQITFEGNNATSHQTINTSGFNYTNPNAPADKSCHVFSANGGGVTPRKIGPTITLDEADIPAYWLYPQSWTVLPIRVLGNGTDANGAASTDLVLQIGYIKKDACLKINEKLGVANPGGNPPLDAYNTGGGNYQGSFANATNPVGDVAALVGKKTFCSTDSQGVSRFHLFKVLIAR